VGMSVARQLRRNMKTTRITRMTERMRVRSTSLTEARIVVVRSRTTVVLMPCGMDASIDGNSARNTIYSVDNVCARLAEDHDGDRRCAIQVSCRPDVLRRIRNIGYIGEPDCLPFVVSDDQRTKLVGMGDLVVRDDVRGRISV